MPSQVEARFRSDIPHPRVISQERISQAECLVPNVGPIIRSGDITIHELSVAAIGIMRYEVTVEYSFFFELPPNRTLAMITSFDVWLNEIQAPVDNREFIVQSIPAAERSGIIMQAIETDQSENTFDVYFQVIPDISHYYSLVLSCCC